MMSKLSFSLLKSDDANWNLAVHSEADLSLWGGGASVESMTVYWLNHSSIFI